MKLAMEVGDEKSSEREEFHDSCWLGILDGMTTTDQLDLQEPVCSENSIMPPAFLATTSTATMLIQAQNRYYHKHRYRPHPCTRMRP